MAQGKMSKPEISNQMQQYKRRRAWMLEYLGGRCKDCGSTVDLEIDHENPADKSFNISKCYSYSLETLIPELNKCCLRCTDCHKQKTQEVDGIKAQHGSLGMYKHHKCRCDVCREAYNRYNREYYAKRAGR